MLAAALTRLMCVREREWGLMGGQVNDAAYDLGAHWVGSSQYHVLAVMDMLGIQKYNQWVTGTKVCVWLWRG